MISFLNGLILPALAAASIPIILHFLSKQKARIIPFSSTKFLKIIENQRIRRVKLYQILLILARTFFIIFLVLAFSRPTFTSETASFTNSQTTALIILDDSYSMQAYAYSKTYFEVAKEKLVDLFSSFNNDDIVFLYSGSMDKPIQITSKNLKKVAAQLKESNGVFDFYKSFQVADSIFKAHINLNNELYLLSDFKFSNNQVLSNINKGEYTFFKVPLADEIPFKNISIDSVIIENQLLEINKPFHISVVLTNHSDEPVESNINLYHFEERVGMDFISLDGNETKTYQTSYIPKSSGQHNLILKLDEDDLSLDNYWYISLLINDEIPTLFISGETSLQLKTALDILEDNTSFKFTRVDYNEWLGIGLNSYDLVIINNFTQMEQRSSLLFKDFIKSGKSIVIIPGNSISLESYDQFLRTLTGKKIKSKIETSSASGYYSIENQKSANIIFDALFRDKSSSFNPPKVFQYINLNTNETQLINLSNNNPYLSKIKNTFIFSSSFNRDWTDIEINGLFLPLLHRTFFYAAQNTTPLSASLNVGDEILFTLENTQVSDNYIIHDPQNNQVTVIPQPVGNSLHFKGSLAKDPGFYTLTQNNRVLATITVNHSSKELKKPFFDSLPNSHEILTLDPENFPDQISNYRIGVELWFVFLVLSFLMILSEIILIKLIEGTPFLKKA